MKVVLQQIIFISINYDEVTTMDNQSQISTHAYVVENWKRQLVLLNFERVVNRGTSNNIIIAIVCSLTNLGSLLMVNVVNKVVCFGADDVTIFQGLKTCVTIQFMDKHNPFIVDIHYMAHVFTIVNPLKGTLNKLSWLK